MKEASDSPSTWSRGQQLLVITPRHLADAQQIIEAVRQQQCVVLNAERVVEPEAQRVIDFTCGGIAAIDGQVHRIDSQTFLFSPATAQIDAPVAEAS